MIYITQLIFVQEGKEDVFNAFENAVIPLMEEHKGKIEYRIRPNTEQFISATGEKPYEVHFVSFQSENDFNNYVNDKRRLDFVHLKEGSIKSTITVKGNVL